MAQTCLVTGFVQIVVFAIYFSREAYPVEIMPVKMYFDFGLKFICCLLLHMIIRPDLKQAVDLLEYLRNPTQIEHVNSSRFMAASLLVLKFSVGIVCETLFILTLSTIDESTGDINKILTIFVIFVIVYEIPTFIFKVKQGNNQMRYFEQLSIYNEIRREYVYINKQVPGKDTLQRARDVDLMVGGIHETLKAVYQIVYVYSYFYLIVLL